MILKHEFELIKNRMEERWKSMNDLEIAETLREYMPDMDVFKFNSVLHYFIGFLDGIKHVTENVKEN